MKQGLAWALAVLAVLAACGEDEQMLISQVCSVDADCAGTPATPYCGPAQTCVACLQSSQCTTSDAPVCDLGTNGCRGCRVDSECASGVCLSVSGTCAAPSQILYVNASSGTNNATCDEKAPCRTMAYTKGLISGARNVIRVIGPLSESVELQTKVHVDGDGSTWSSTFAVLDVGTANGAVTVEGFRMRGPAGTAAQSVVQCLNQGALRLHDVEITGAGGSLPAVYSLCDTQITNSVINNNPGGAVYCEGKSLTISNSTLRDNLTRTVDTMGCSVTMSRTRVIANAGAQAAVSVRDAPALLIENNIITDAVSPMSRGLQVSNAPSGGQIRFNTFVNTAQGTHTAEGVSCDGTAVVTSNLIAWQNGLAQGANACSRRYNAFDANTAIGSGEGNVSAALSSLLVNPANDYHLAPGSVAHGLGEPGLKVPADFDGKARPGDGRLDAGALETQ